MDPKAENLKRNHKMSNAENVIPTFFSEKSIWWCVMQHYFPNLVVYVPTSDVTLCDLMYKNVQFIWKYVC